jgi:hypothetical protein
VARGIDHVVHAVADLDAVAALYRSLGFQVGARNRHPPAWGTQNHIVQLPGCFVELLAVADAAHIAPHGPRHFSFGAFNRDALRRGQGLSMLVLDSREATGDARTFREAGIGDFNVFDFEREARRPDGGTVKVAFSLAFASDPLAPGIGFFTCRQHFPENFWNPAFQLHANAATAIAGVVIVAARPSGHRAFLAAFTGEREVAGTPGGILVQTARGEIEVLEPAAFQDRFGQAPPDTARGARLAALRFAVGDPAVTAAVLHASGVPAFNRNETLIIGPQAAMGATLVFEPVRTA